jgi:flagellar protein FliO/FliZ
MSAPEAAVSQTSFAVQGSPEAAASAVAEAVTGTAAGIMHKAGDGLAQGISAFGADSVFSWSGYFQALAILFLVIALLWAGVWFLKKRGGIQKLGILTKDLRVESRMALGPKKALIVVRFLNKRLLLGVTDQQITLLTELTDDDDTDCDAPAAAKDRAAAFRAALAAAGEEQEP